MIRHDGLSAAKTPVVGPSVRNSFLAAAFELRNGFPTGSTSQPVNPDLVRAMSTELFLDYLGIRVDTEKARGLSFTMNLYTPDNDEKFVVELSNSTLTNSKGFEVPNPDFSLTLNRSDLERVMSGSITLLELITAGLAKLVGDGGVLEQFRNVLVQFSPDFELLPGTSPSLFGLAPNTTNLSIAESDVFSQVEPAQSAGG